MNDADSVLKLTCIDRRDDLVLGQPELLASCLVAERCAFPALFFLHGAASSISRELHPSKSVRLLADVGPDDEWGPYRKRILVRDGEQGQCEEGNELRLGRGRISAMAGGRNKPAEDPIGAFWAWWSTARRRVEAAVETGDYGTLRDELSSNVSAIHPNLEWELGTGRVARHVLCVTSAGVAERRSLAERWRLAGRHPDAT